MSANRPYPFKNVEYCDLHVVNNGNVYQMSRHVFSKLSYRYTKETKSGPITGYQTYVIPDEYKSGSLDYLFTYLPYQPKRDTERKYIENDNSIFLDSLYEEDCDQLSSQREVLQLYQYLECSNGEFLTNVFNDILNNIARGDGRCDTWYENFSIICNDFTHDPSIFSRRFFHSVIENHKNDVDVMNCLDKSILIKYISGEFDVF